MRNISDLIDMRSRISLITGATGHIGKTIAATLAELGSDLILLDQEKPGLESLAKELSEAYRVNINVFACDLESDHDVATIPKWIEGNVGRLDVLINNAAFVGSSDMQGWSTHFQEQTLETWRRALEVNLTAPFSLIKGCAPLLASSGHGSIVNVGSIYGVLGPDLSLYDGTGLNNPAAYAASKGGLIQLTRWLATVLSPNIRVNALSPGGVARSQPPLFVERYIKRTPLRRMGREQDFKGAIAFLASDLSEWVTGQNIMVDGGWSIW